MCTREETFKALLLQIKSMRPRTPSRIEADSVVRLIFSILDPQRKGYTNFLNLTTLNSGRGRTLARYQNLLAPIMLTIRAFPTNESDLDFHRFKLVSSLDRRGSQFSGSTLTLPLLNQTPKYFHFRNPC